MNKDKNHKLAKRVYLDTASQTLISKQVALAMKKVSLVNFNPANIYKEGVEAKNILENSRQGVADILGVKSHEIYFTSSGTLSCATAILGIVKQYKKANLKNKNYIPPHIIISNIEHPAVYENVKYLENAGEIEVSYIEADSDGLISKDKVKTAIKINTILISIMYVNNEIGIIQDIKGISKKIKEWKIENKKPVNSYPFFHTDAAQAGNYLSLYIDRLGVDMLSLNGSKIYGPKYTAVLFKKEYVKLSPIYYGGGQERGIFSGTIDIQKVSGLALALKLAQSKIQDFKKIEKLAKLRNTLAKNILQNIPVAKINGFYNELEWQVEKKGVERELRISKRLPNNLSIYLPGFPADEMVLRLDREGFAVSAGSACSARENEYSRVIFALYKNQTKEKIAKQKAQESIRITFDESISENELSDFAKILQDIYYKYKV